MSCCMTCMRAMDDSEARQFEDCRSCRKKLAKSRRVRDLNKKGTECIGRQGMPSRIAGVLSDIEELVRDGEF